MDQFQNSSSFPELTTPSQDNNNNKIQEIEMAISKLDKKMKELEGYTEQVKSLHKAINDLDSQTKNLKNNNASLKKKMENSEKESIKRSIEILGIFVAIITFVSISTTAALSLVSVYHILFFIVIFALCLLAFITLLIHLLRYEKKSIFLCSMAFIVLIGIGMALFWYCNNKKILFLHKNSPDNYQNTIINSTNNS